MLVPWKENYDKPMQPIKKQRYHFADKGPQTSPRLHAHVCTRLRWGHLRHWNLLRVATPRMAVPRLMVGGGW